MVSSIQSNSYLPTSTDYVNWCTSERTSRIISIAWAIFGLVIASSTIIVAYFAAHAVVILIAIWSATTALASIIASLCNRLFQNKLNRAKETLQKGLKNWIDEAPQNERDSRIEAKDKILKKFQDGSISLNLERLRLTSLPSQIGQLDTLSSLKLGYNRLTAVPAQIWKLKELASLDLVSNQFTSLPPEIDQLKKLTILCLDENQLSSLPNEILNLPAKTNIFLDNNPLSSNVTNHLSQATRALNYQGPRIFISRYETRDRFLNTLTAVRHELSQAALNLGLQSTNSSERSLEALLQELSEAAERPTLQLTRLLGNQSLRLWLSRLAAIGDYQNKRQELAIKIYEAIAHAEVDEPFFQIFLNCIQGASTTCGDRMALSVLYLDLQHEIAKTRDLKRLAYLLGHGSWALSELEKIAGNKVLSLHFVDEIEVYLAYPVMLKEKLKLPIAIDSMLYFRISSVTQADLQRAEEIVKEMLSNVSAYCHFLASQDAWQKALEGRDDYQKLLEKRNASEDYVVAGTIFQQDLEKLTKRILSEVGYPPFIKAA